MAGAAVVRRSAASSFASLAEVACRGNADAQVALAADYLQGRSVPASNGAAADWLGRAAASGHAGAMVQLAKLALAGDLPANGPSVLFAPLQPQEPCFVRARDWAKRAVAAGSAEGKVVLAAVLAQGPAEWHDPVAIRALLDDAAASGSASAAFSLAIQHAQHRSADPATIVGLLRTAAEGGLAAATYLHGVATEVGAGCKRHPVAAVACYRLAAEQGFVWAQARLGRALIHGIGADPDPFGGETWLRMAARAGNAAAAALLGDWYARASPVTNYLEAGHWFLRAAELGDAASARIASVLHLTATGLHGDWRDAALCLRRAEGLASSVVAASDTDPAGLIAGGVADLCGAIDVRGWFAPLAGSGDHRAAHRLGVCFAMGIGGRKDIARAAEWLGRAAPWLPPAQLLYGQILLDDSHARHDPAEGCIWVQRAAMAGLPEARVALAELLANGRGCKRDAQAALNLFTEAANGGHRGAMYAAGALHGGGHGIALDRALALAWFRKAAEAGHGRAQLMLGRYLAVGWAGERDRAASATWLRRALGNGEREAREDLAALAEIG